MSDIPAAHDQWSPDEQAVLEYVRSAALGGRTDFKMTLLFTLFHGDSEAFVAAVADGLQAGRAVYGPLVIEGDSREFEAEFLAEIRDAAVYLAAMRIRGQNAEG
jgi:hypothetical protein